MNPTDNLKVGDTVKYTGTEFRFLIGATGVVKAVENNWVITEEGPLSTGAFPRNLTVIKRAEEPDPTFEVGDTVVLADDGFFHRDAQGQRATVTHTPDLGGSYRVDVPGVGQQYAPARLMTKVESSTADTVRAKARDLRKQSEDLHKQADLLATQADTLDQAAALIGDIK